MHALDDSLDFDATQVKPSTGVPDPVPNGTYPLQITKAEKKPIVRSEKNPSDSSWGVAVELTVLDGEYKGRKVFPQFNLQHANADTMRIANEQFSALCHAINVMKPRNLGELVGHACQGKLIVEPPQNGYSAKNKVVEYLRIDGSKIGGGSAAFPAAAPAAKKATTGPVWAQKKSA